MQCRLKLKTEALTDDIDWANFQDTSCFYHFNIVASWLYQFKIIDIWYLYFIFIYPESFIFPLSIFYRENALREIDNRVHFFQASYMSLFWMILLLSIQAREHVHEFLCCNSQYLDDVSQDNKSSPGNIFHSSVLS